MGAAERLTAIYEALYAHFGPQGWWPGETPLEVMVGAILTQNTNWANAEKAIHNLKGAGLLMLPRLLDLPTALLAEYIRPTGYFNIKAARLHNLLRLIAGDHDGDLAAFLAQPLPRLREQLLGVKGIGPETADAIILYAAKQPVFVVDAYTFRLLSRHDLADDTADYASLQALFMDQLPEDVAMYGEYHALIVKACKEYCRKAQPLCEGCPLREM